MENYSRLCPIENNTYENIKDNWHKISPEATELYVEYLIPLELIGEEQKSYIKEFILSFTEAFCNKVSGKKYRELIDKGVSAIYLCLARTSISPCKKKKIKQLVLNIQYNLYNEEIIKNEGIIKNEKENETNLKNENQEIKNKNKERIEIKFNEFILILFILIFLTLILYLINTQQFHIKL